MTKVSIVIPVYNVAQYLQECLDSLVHQTLQAIEMICVDDASTDGSAALLDKYAAQDSRFRVIHYTENHSAAQARKDGVLMATGAYIMFVDGDDTLALDTCERLYALMEQYQVDILHFGTTIAASSEIDPARIGAMERMVMPYRGALYGETLINDCFVAQKFHYQLWNKIYRADVCKKAFRCFPDGAFPKAQDLFAFYLIAYFSRSYLGLSKELCYTYHFGRGVTGHNTIRRPTIRRYASQALVVRGIRTFLEQQQALAAYNKSLEAVRKRLLHDTVNQLIYHIAAEDRAFAFDVMCESWGADAIIGQLALTQCPQAGQWATAFQHAKTIAVSPRKVHCIGTFYHSLRNGGAQRVVAMLAQLWVQLGYRVVIFTEASPTPEDYAIPAGVERVVLPSFDAAPEKRMQRSALLRASIQQYHIDLYVHHAWVAASTLWDLLSVRSAGALFYIHAHNVFSMPLLTASVTHRFFQMPDIYALADGIMVLSSTDAVYWRHFNARVFVVKNPLPFDPKAYPAYPRNGRTVLWLGRIASEKNPVQAIEVFSRVAAQVPDARLLLVGNGSHALEQAMTQRAKELNILHLVEFCGFHTDVAPFYQRSDVFLCTSQYEGYPLTLLEAQSFGLPVVTYDMPYLTILESGKGSICVPQNDKEAAARAIVALLKDDDLRHRLGAEARTNVLQQCDADFPTMWTEILNSAQQPRQPVAIDPDAQKMLSTLMSHIQRFSTSRMPTAQAVPVIAAPLPAHGPLKTLRKKLHTARNVVRIKGLSYVRVVLKENWEARK